MAPVTAIVNRVGRPGQGLARNVDRVQEVRTSASSGDKTRSSDEGVSCVIVTR